MTEGVRARLRHQPEQRNERLRVYGASYHLKLTSVPGQGTCASGDSELTMPERVTA
jgi:hypothetical protein